MWLALCWCNASAYDLRPGRVPDLGNHGHVIEQVSQGGGLVTQDSQLQGQVNTRLVDILVAGTPEGLLPLSTSSSASSYLSQPPY